MSAGCKYCGGLIPEEGKVYGYAGKFCNCWQKPMWISFPPMVEKAPQGEPYPGQTIVPAPLTEADVRRIIRDEMDKREGKLP